MLNVVVTFAGFFFLFLLLVHLLLLLVPLLLLLLLFLLLIILRASNLCFKSRLIQASVICEQLLNNKSTVQTPVYVHVLVSKKFSLVSFKFHFSSSIFFFAFYYSSTTGGFFVSSASTEFDSKRSFVCCCYFSKLDNTKIHIFSLQLLEKRRKKRCKANRRARKCTLFVHRELKKNNKTKRKRVVVS